MGRRLLFPAVVALLLVTAGCGGLDGTGAPTDATTSTTPTTHGTTTETRTTDNSTTTASSSGDLPAASSVTADALAAARAVDTYRVNGTLNQTLDNNRVTQQFDTELRAVFDRSDREFRINQTVRALGKTVPASQYFVGGTLYQYSRQSRQRVGSAWTEVNLSGNASAFWNSSDTLARQRAILNASTVEMTGTTTADGVETYVLDVNATDAGVDVLGSTAIPADELDVTDLSGTFYVATGTDQLVKSVTHLNATVTRGGSTARIDQTATLRFTDYDADVNVTLPPDADDAVAVGENGTGTGTGTTV